MGIGDHSKGWLGRGSKGRKGHNRLEVSVREKLGQAKLGHVRGYGLSKIFGFLLLLKHRGQCAPIIRAQDIPTMSLTSAPTCLLYAQHGIIL